MTSELKIVEIEFEDPKILEFINKWEHDIQNFFPHFTEEDADFSSIYTLEYEGKEAGIFIYQRKGEELHVHIDYVIPEYRDLGIGEDFFEQKIDEFRNTGFATVVALTSNEKHSTYLCSLGFTLSSKHPHRYELDLTKRNN